MSSRRFEILLFVLLFGSFAYFHHPEPGWNVNSRFALTLAIVERGTFRIDGYDQAGDTGTGDVAVFNGHVYSDKIIGVSLLGVPAFAAVRAAEALSGRSVPTGARRYFVTLFSVGLLGALSGVLLFRLMMLVGLRGGDPISPVGPFVLTAITFLGSLLFLYGTLYMAYLPAQFFALWGVWLFERWKTSVPSVTTGESPTQNLPGPPLFACGVLFGCAMLCEYTVGIAAGLFGLYVLMAIPRRCDIWRYAFGCILALLPFFVYTFSIFGRLAIPYEFERSDFFRQYMARGLMGATVPRLSVLYLITLHPYRGLFIHSPFLLVALVGLWQMLKSQCLRLFALLVLCVATTYLLFNSAYYMWWGGWSFSPRILGPMIPFLSIPLVVAWRDWRLRTAILVLGAVGIGIHLIVNAVDPQFRDQNPYTHLPQLLNPSLGTAYPWVFTLYVCPLFWLGDFGRNAGQVLGLRGPASVVPLLVFWLGVAAVVGYWSLRKPAGAVQPAA